METTRYLSPLSRWHWVKFQGKYLNVKRFFFPCQNKNIQRFSCAPWPTFTFGHHLPTRRSKCPQRKKTWELQSRGPRISTQNNVPKQKNILEESKLKRDLLAAGGLTLSDLATCVLTVTHAAYKVWLNQFRQSRKKSDMVTLKNIFTYTDHPKPTGQGSVSQLDLFQVVRNKIPRMVVGWRFTSVESKKNHLTQQKQAVAWKILLQYPFAAPTSLFCFQALAPTVKDGSAKIFTSSRGSGLRGLLTFFWFYMEAVEFTGCVIIVPMNY